MNFMNNRTTDETLHPWFSYYNKRKICIKCSKPLIFYEKWSIISVYIYVRKKMFIKWQQLMKEKNINRIIFCTL